MKKIIILFAFCSLSFAKQAQSQDKIRSYRSSTYTVGSNGEKRTEKTTIAIRWVDDNATNLDNIQHILYPAGFVIPRTTPSYFSTLDNGSKVFKFTGLDEGKREIECYITKYSESRIGIMLYYSTNLYYAFTIQLDEFLYSE